MVSGPNACVAQRGSAFRRTWVSGEELAGVGEARFCLLLWDHFQHPFLQACDRSIAVYRREGG
jgi:hypothetical protein